MGIPQIILIVIYALALGISLSRHGKTEMRTENFGTTLIGTVLQVALLYWGGFFG